MTVEAQMIAQFRGQSGVQHSAQRCLQQPVAAAKRDPFGAGLFNELRRDHVQLTTHHEVRTSSPDIAGDVSSSFMIRSVFVPRLQHAGTIHQVTLFPHAIGETVDSKRRKPQFMRSDTGQGGRSILVMTAKRTAGCGCA